IDGNVFEYTFSGLKDGEYGKKGKKLSDILSPTDSKDDNGEIFTGKNGLVQEFEKYINEFKPKLNTELEKNFGATVTIDKDKINSSLPTTITSDVNFLGVDSKG